jgi:enoyl-CoA hydratase
MSYETLLTAISDRIAIVTINRPEKRNALNARVRSEIIDALDAMRNDNDVRVVVFTGAGDRAFIAGADIGEFADRTPLEQRAVMEGRRVFDEIASFPKPTIAMINGFALGGGCELALACDLRIAAQSAKLGQPEVRLGLIPGGGGTQRLPRLVGTGRALRLIMTGELVEAEEAWRIGLVDALVHDDRLRDETMATARGLAALSPVALRMAKAAVAAAWEAPLAAGLAYERELFITAFASDDRREGVAAFMQKRTAEFTGR